MMSGIKLFKNIIKWSVDLIFLILILFFCSPLFVGFSIIFYQVFYWLKTEKWISYPISKALSLLSPTNSFILWLKNPHSWFGLHTVVLKLIYIIPISAVLIIFGIIFLDIVLNYRHNFKKNNLYHWLET